MKQTNPELKTPETIQPSITFTKTKLINTQNLNSFTFLHFPINQPHCATCSASNLKLHTKRVKLIRNQYHIELHIQRQYSQHPRSKFVYFPTLSHQSKTHTAYSNISYEINQTNP